MDYKKLIEMLRDESNCDVLDYIEDATTAIETLLAEREAAGWISVEDKLPDYGDIVLIFENSHWDTGVNVARFIKDEVFDNNKKPYSWIAPQGPMQWFGQYVTHWMPLPTPPDRQQSESQKDKPKEIYNDGKYRAVVVVE